MSRVVRGSLIQATLCEPSTSPVATIKNTMIDKHVALIADAAKLGAQVVCLQELFYGPYFVPSNSRDGMSSPSACPMAPRPG